MDYLHIKTQKDAEYFIEKTNSLHDGFVISVQYTNDAITHLDEKGCIIDPYNTKLVLRILVTSIWDAIAEIEFKALREWKIKDNQLDIINTSIIFDERNFIIWSYNVHSNMGELKEGSYAIAKYMKWRIVE